jgi:hypothetical protein
MPHPGRARDFADHHANAMEKVLDASNGVEVLVLAGSSEGGEVFEMQSWLRLPKDSITLATVGINGARVWIKRGHLAEIPRPRSLGRTK